MSINEIVKTYYQMLARQCGYWSAAHCMRKRGYTIDQCEEALIDVRHCKRVWMRTGVLGLPSDAFQLQRKSKALR
jgi:hypothetical protein